jgi:hypothetical protein
VELSVPLWSRFGALAAGGSQPCAIFPEPKTTLDIRTDHLDPRTTSVGLQPGIAEKAGFALGGHGRPQGNEFCVCTEPRPDT